MHNNDLKERFEQILNQYDFIQAIKDDKPIPESYLDLMQEAYNLAIQDNIEIYKWLLGYYDFPEPPKDGRAKYYWRSALRDKLKGIGIEIDSPKSPFQPRETDLPSPPVTK